MFEPRAVALIGASENPAKVGGRVMDNLLAGGFQGRLYAVNPKYQSVRGIACVAEVSQLPDAVDLAVIATPAATVATVVEQCGVAGIRAVVVITAGFRELGAEGIAREREVLAAARRHGVRVLGPNCIGLMRPSIGLDATFARGGALPGSLALVAQSGAVCTAILDWARPMGVGFSSVISLGGSSDVDFGEIVDYLAGDPATRQILMYIEGVRDGRGLVSSLRAVARFKPVIMMKVGRFPVGARAALSHTGAIVGGDAVFDAMVRRTGVVRVRSTGELAGAALALATGMRPGGDRLAIVTNGGGPGVMAADRATELGLPLASLAPQTVARLQSALPANWSHGNPIDLIGDAGAQRYSAAISACLDDPGVDGVVAILCPQAMTSADDAASAVIAAAKGSHKPLIACWMGGASVAAGRALFGKAGIPAYRLPEPAIEAFAHLAEFHRNQRLLLEAPPPLTHRQPPDLEAARAIVKAALRAGQTVLGATESKELLAAFHIPVIRSLNAATADDAVAAARDAGYPVAMKIRSPDITHKSDVGGVCLGLEDEAAVRRAFAAMMSPVAKAIPGARIEGVSVEAMAAPGGGARELMLGIATDAVFGPAISFGAGGIAVEVLKDRSVELPPLNALLAAGMIRRTRIAAMLGAFRHLPAANHAAIVDVLLRVSEMACELPEVAELDVNPLVADEHGVVALDARVVLVAAPAGAGPHDHLAIEPYPSDLETVEVLGGESLTLRPIRAEDALLEQELVERLSPHARHMRFQGALRHLTPAALAQFTQVDYDRDMALVAIQDKAGVPLQVGVCRYVRLPDGDSCEYAIVLADEWQGRGLGWRMMTRLIEIARRQGLRTMTGQVLATNKPMLDLCRRLGFGVAAMPGDAALREVTLRLDEVAPVA